MKFLITLAKSLLLHSSSFILSEDFLHEFNYYLRILVSLCDEKFSLK